MDLYEAKYTELEKRYNILLTERNALKSENDTLLLTTINGMSPNRYQMMALRTEPLDIKCCGLSKRLSHGLMGLNGEAGEAIDILKKHLYQGHELDREHLAKELGDVAWYLAVTADALGYTLEDIFKMNLEKIKARYPDGFKADRSINRDENDI